MELPTYFSLSAVFYSQIYDTKTQMHVLQVCKAFTAISIVFIVACIMYGF